MLACDRRYNKNPWKLQLSCINQNKVKLRSAAHIPMSDGIGVDSGSPLTPSPRTILDHPAFRSSSISQRHYFQGTLPSCSDRMPALAYRNNTSISGLAFTGLTHRFYWVITIDEEIYL